MQQNPQSQALGVLYVKNQNFKHFGSMTADETNLLLPVGKFLGVGEAGGQRGVLIQAGGSTTLYDEQLHNALNALMLCPSVTEFKTELGAWGDPDPGGTLEYLLGQGIAVAVGEDAGVDALNQLALVIELTPVRDVSLNGEPSEYLSPDGRSLELGAALTLVGLTNSEEVSLLEAVAALSAETDEDPALVLGAVLADLPMLFHNGGGHLERIR